MSIFYDKERQETKVINVVIVSFLVLLVLWIIVSFVGPVYNVWQQGLAGQAELKRAEQNRQIAILEAQAQNEAATSQALAKIKIAEAEGQAEVARATGAAEANRILGDSLKNNEQYLRYIWIKELAGHDGVIYVPTEAGLPILEAGKRN